MMPGMDANADARFPGYRRIQVVGATTPTAGPSLLINNLASTDSYPSVESLCGRSCWHAYRDSLNPAAAARQITDLQTVLLKLAKNKTEQLYLASFPTGLPDVHKGIRIKAS